MNVKENRKINQCEDIRNQISRTRRALIKADERGEDTTRYTTQIKELKETLFKLEGTWETEFSLSKRKVKDSGGKDWYLIEVKYHGNVVTYSIYKYDGEWCSSDTPIKSTRHTDLVNALETKIKKEWNLI